MSVSGTVIVAVSLALLDLVIAGFATVSRPHAVAVRGAESSRDLFSFDPRH